MLNLQTQQSAINTGKEIKIIEIKKPKLNFNLFLLEVLTNFLNKRSVKGIATIALVKTKNALKKDSKYVFLK